jgi:hypothetical protein
MTLRARDITFPYGITFKPSTTELNGIARFTVLKGLAKPGNDGALIANNRTVLASLSLCCGVRVFLPLAYP